jgi:hypothetical protein
VGAAIKRATIAARTLAICDELAPARDNRARDRVHRRDAGPSRARRRLGHQRTPGGLVVQPACKVRSRSSTRKARTGRGHSSTIAPGPNYFASGAMVQGWHPLRTANGCTVPHERVYVLHEQVHGCAQKTASFCGAPCCKSHGFLHLAVKRTSEVYPEALPEARPSGACVRCSQTCAEALARALRSPR